MDIFSPRILPNNLTASHTKDVLPLLRTLPTLCLHFRMKYYFLLFFVFMVKILQRITLMNSLFSSIKTSAIKMTNEKYDYYVNGAATFHIDFNTLEDNGDTSSLNTIAVEKSSFPIRGILSILIFVGGLFGCVQWLKDSENGVFAPMSYTFHRISRILYIIIPTLLFAISSLITIYLANVQVSPWIELKSMVSYIFY